MLFVSLLLISGVSALSVDLKENYDRGESMILKISGVVADPITKDNVKFRRGHVLVPFEYDLVKLGGDYYLWAITPKTENNYSLIINDVFTTVEGELMQIDFIQNFSVSDNLSPYSVKPGAILARDDFELIIKLNEDLDRLIDIGGFEYVLKPGENKIDFSIAGLYGTQLYNISVGDYSVFAYVIGGDAPVTISEVINESAVGEADLRVSPSSIESVLIDGQTKSYNLVISNLGNTTIEDISFGFNSDIFTVSPESLDVDAGEEVNVSISLKEGVEQDFDEIIQIEYLGYVTRISIEVEFNEAPTTAGRGVVLTENMYCADLGGSLCDATKECSGEKKVAKDGGCCIGFCKDAEKEPTNTGLIVGIILILVVILGSIIVLKKYKGVKKKSPFPQASKKSLP